MKYLSLVLLFTLTSSVFAKEGGNGGGVHVCRNKYELYDFFEGRDARGHNIKIWKNDRKLSFNDYIEKALTHVKNDIPEVSDSVSQMVSKILSTPEKDLYVDISIPIIEDANPTVIGKDCSYQQAANWNERFHKLFISKELFSKLDNMNKAGLILHEAIYKLSRETKVANETSDSVREVVARIFSDEKLTRVDSEVISSQEARNLATRPHCDSAKSSFAQVDELMKKNVSDKRYHDLVVNVVNFCLKYCHIEEERKICEKRLNE